jgi:ribosomal protein S18 acetylase RimI-like enzyme
VAIPADNAGWLELVRSSMPPFWRLVAERTGGRVWEREGVLASIVPASPQRSFFNSVLYEGPEPMIEAIEDLADAYEEAGIAAWTVWVPEDDADVARALQLAGHKLDATPRAMAMPIADLRPPEPDPELEIREEDDQELLAQINEAAYGFAPGEFPPLEGEAPGLRTYFGSIGGETVGCAAALAHGGDCEITYVAVLPEGRGRGIAGRMMTRALADAAEQGLETTTLQSTKLGYPIYLKLGYRDYGVLEMWERRKPAASE